MITTSEAFKELMKSNVRPKCEPVITISGIDNNGNETSLTWQAKDIKSLTYKRGIDPVGRELPYMELSWTEIYKGKLNAQNYPEKYNNIVKYMEVELSFVQSLGFYNSWKTLFNSNTTWKTLFENNISWKTLKNSINTETIKLPKMFLAARPTIEGSTIKWVAKDLISFLDENQIKSFTGEITPIPFINPLIYLILNARGSYLNSKELFVALTKTASKLEELQDKFPELDKTIIFDKATKDCIMNYANLQNLYWNFIDNIPILQSGYVDSDFKFNTKIIHSYPKITNSTNISSYNFKHYVAETDLNSPYIKDSITKKISIGDSTIDVNVWLFDKYGTIEESGSIFNEINYAVSADTSGRLTIFPVNYNGYDNILNTGKVGETYVEDNPLNPYDSNSIFAKSRLNFLDNYFNQDSSVLEWTCIANPTIEAGDTVSVVTNLYDSDGKNIEKKCVIVQLEISYNGALKEKIIAHEVKL